MRPLKEDIETFLASYGLDFREITADGMTVLAVKCRVSGEERLIIPYEIREKTAEEAERRHVMLSESLSGTATPPILITEDRWRRRPEMMKGRMLAHLEIFRRLYARNCTVRRIDKAESGAFLEANHSYGDAACRYRYGMFLERYTGHTEKEIRLAEGNIPVPGDLVAVAEFSNARRWEKGGKVIGSYEWVRYASLPGIRISGGMGKMLQHFIGEVSPDDIMSYADLEWSEGSVYVSLGFRPESHKAPVLFTIDPGTWERKAVQSGSGNGKDGVPDGKQDGGLLYFMNSGSLKYRLKITEY